MDTKGRTIREAIEDGNAFEMSGPMGFNYFPPAATTADEVMAWAADSKYFTLRPGRYEMHRIIGGSIGGFIVESVKAVTWDGATYQEAR